ncbi:MAG: fluoride efflux transporter CrcB [Geodermatophilaceae bacterium]|jgi:CrcB protein
MTAMWVAVGAAAGAPLRYLVDRELRAWLGERFPWGILLCNLAGSLVLGVVAGIAVDTEWNAVVGTGFCGTLTTYSTFGYDTVRLAQRGRDGERGQSVRALLNVVGSIVLGVGAAIAGVSLGQSSSS